jgi:hypothetical protein
MLVQFGESRGSCRVKSDHVARLRSRAVPDPALAEPVRFGECGKIPAPLRDRMDTSNHPTGARGRVLNLDVVPRPLPLERYKIVVLPKVRTEFAEGNSDRVEGSRVVAVKKSYSSFDCAYRSGRPGRSSQALLGPLPSRSRPPLHSPGCVHWTCACARSVAQSAWARTQRRCRQPRRDHHTFLMHRPHHEACRGSPVHSGWGPLRHHHGGARLDRA